MIPNLYTVERKRSERMQQQEEERAKHFYWNHILQRMEIYVNGPGFENHT